MPTNTAPQLFHPTGGKLLIPVGSGKDFARNVGVQGDGNIVIAKGSDGASGADFSAVRLNTEGVFDTCFEQARRYARARDKALSLHDPHRDARSCACTGAKPLCSPICSSRTASCRSVTKAPRALQAPWRQTSRFGGICPSGRSTYCHKNTPE